MHVLRLYCNVNKVNAKVPLNEKELLSVYHAYGATIDSMKFVELLLFCRAVFDRFIVKTTDDASDQEDGRKWVLLKPTRYESNWQYTSSFEGKKGRQLVKALSMLQVTFRTRIYKTWLYAVLEWLHGKCGENGDFGAVSVDAYLGFLHGWMLRYYNTQGFKVPEIPDGETPSKANSYSLGTATPHFLLNFIDYLYWCDWRRNKEKYEKYGRFRELEDFSFKYWNSVEHHLARNNVEEDCQYIHNLGNLCLVSKSSNSRLSDRFVQEKVDKYGNGNLGPNRIIIYEETREANYEWKEAQIRDHYNEIVALLDNRQSILPADSNFTETGTSCVDLTNDMDALGKFIEQHFFDLNLPNGYSVVVRKGDDAESPTEWCGRYFDICCDDDVVKAWVGWLYGVGAYKNSPRFVIQVKKEKFSELPGSSDSEWYPDTFWKIWMNKDIANSLDDMDAVANKFKKEIEVLCTHM